MVEIHANTPAHAVTRQRSVVDIVELEFQYRNGFRLGPISVSLTAGITALVGPNGAGKTTLLNVLSGLYRTTAGRVESGNHVLDDVERRRRFALVRLENAWYDDATVADHLTLFRTFSPLWDKKIAADLMERFALDPQLKLKAASSGMKAKLGIIGALARRSDVLMLDEPWNALDPPARVDLSETLQDLARDGERCILLSSHELTEIETVAERVIAVRHGAVTGDEPWTPVVRSERNDTLLRIYRGNDG